MKDFQAISERYVADVASGKIAACNWVKLACRRRADDVKRQGAEDFPYVYDSAKGERVCKFIEKLPHTQGFHGRISLEP